MSVAARIMKKSCRESIGMNSISGTDEYIVFSLTRLSVARDGICKSDHHRLGSANKKNRRGSVYQNPLLFD